MFPHPAVSAQYSPTRITVLHDTVHQSISVHCHNNTPCPKNESLWWNKACSLWALTSPHSEWVTDSRHSNPPHPELWSMAKPQIFDFWWQDTFHFSSRPLPRSPHFSIGPLINYPHPCVQFCSDKDLDHRWTQMICWTSTLWRIVVAYKVHSLTCSTHTWKCLHGEEKVLWDLIHLRPQAQKWESGKSCFFFSHSCQICWDDVVVEFPSVLDLLLTCVLY